MAAAAKPAKPAYELSGWERFKKDVVRDKWLYPDSDHPRFDDERDAQHEV